MRLILVSLLILFSTSSALADECADLLKQVSEIDQKIADIAAERALTEAFRNMSVAIDDAIADLNKSKDKTEEYKNKLQELEDLLGEKFEQTGQVIKGTKAGTEKLKKALGDTTDGLSKAQLAFQVYLEVRKRGDNTDPAESLRTLVASYDFLKGALGPLIEQVPVIGQFLAAYGEALKSASNIATKLQETRTMQANLVDSIPELSGGNPFRFPTAKDTELKKLNSERAKLIQVLEDKNCGQPEEPEEAETPPEVAQSRTAARRQCLADLQLTEDPESVLFTSLNKKDQAFRDRSKARAKLEEYELLLPGHKKMVASAEAALKTDNERKKRAINDMKFAPDYFAFEAEMKKIAAGFPDSASSRDCRIAEGATSQQSLEGEKVRFSSQLQSAVAGFCKIVYASRAQEEKISKARDTLTATQTAITEANQEITRLNTLISSLYDIIEAARKNLKRLQDCIDKNANYIDISGRYWSRYTEDILVVKRSGPNYIFSYEAPSAKEANLRGVKKSDQWFIGRLEDGKLKGIYLQRFPLSVRTEWGCSNPGGWVDSEGLIWASGEWLSFTADTKFINANCELSKAGDTFTVYKEGSKSYKRFHP